MIRTVTYDDSTYKLVPLEPDDEQLFRLNESLYDSRNKVWYERASDAYKAGIAAAPEYQEMKTYCLGYTHDKCSSCIHDANWHALNEMPDSDRLEWQKNMTRINSDKCRMTSMGEYAPVQKYQEPTKDEL